jgi:hypothetical protein
MDAVELLAVALSLCETAFSWPRFCHSSTLRYAPLSILEEHPCIHSYAG